MPLKTKQFSLTHVQRSVKLTTTTVVFRKFDYKDKKTKKKNWTMRAYVTYKLKAATKSNRASKKKKLVMTCIFTYIHMYTCTNFPANDSLTD